MKKSITNRNNYPVAEAKEISFDFEKKDLWLNLIHTSRAHENGSCCANISLYADAVYTSQCDKILSLCVCWYNYMPKQGIVPGFTPDNCLQEEFQYIFKTV